MSRRRYHMPPPATDRHVSGQILDLVPVPGTPEPRPEKMVELRPAGPPPLVLELRAEDELVNPGKPLPPLPQPDNPPAAPNEPQA